MMSEDDTELRDVVAQTLEGNGVLGNIRAQLRACVFLALEEHDTKSSKSPFENSDLKEFLKTKRGRLSFSFVKEILDHFNLQHTLSVLHPEAGLDDDLLDSNELIKEFSLPKSNKNGPVLGDLVEQFSTKGKGDATQSTQNMVTVIPEDLSAQQVEDARKQFRQFDKDRNGFIDKEELRDLFQTMFPAFNTSMLDRYVNDEFRASDKDFSSGIDFVEFLDFYKRLFIQCRGVVAGSASTFNNTTSNNQPSVHTNVSRNSSQSYDLKADNLVDDDADFFDDPLPDTQSTKLGRASTLSNGNASNMSSLQGMPSLTSEKKDQRPQQGNSSNSVGNKLVDFGLDEYQDDFDDSPSVKTLSARSDKSKKSQGSIEEEIDEQIEIEDDNVNSQSAVDDFTTDVTIDSDRSLGIDYIEEAKH